MAARTFIPSGSRCLRMGVGRTAGLAEELAKLSLFPVPRLSRSLATEVSAPSALVQTIPPEPPKPQPKFYTKPPTVLATVYKFPTLEPLAFETYPSTFLQALLRRDILHRAIIYEGDKTRRGRAQTKTRSEIHGSGRKLRPQKGSGRARLGDKSSPMLRGGAKAHGPKARDFSTGLPRKVYDMAFRIAFSYRYRRGDLIVVDELSGHLFPDAWYVKDLLKQNAWGRENKNTMFITMRKNVGLSGALGRLEKEGRALSVEEVDCKNLLEMGRVVIEKSALEYFLEKRWSPEVKV
ncbi:50S ribosomal protein-like protein L4 [Terfezia boudieri ATCC MYA-4762]|uniref:Large ribosomal subunit protein uL4m n=1 Tax=Terfezia boudieri ATCC MYA-4762 TaxID=1051890 RepID=A0A3N4M839_9PEZI|nr:50S ribosomal protein-like protein L4 [Terfezia boudieri ATCC MYA-4762]